MSITIKDIKVVALDFDGVITVAGENAKQDGWKVLFGELKKEGFREDIAEVYKRNEEYFTGKDGKGMIKGNRYDMLWVTFREFGISGEETCDLVKRIARRYDEVTRELIVKSGVYDETLIALNKWAISKLPLYIVSATPTEAVSESVTALNLGVRFKNIFGFPPRKPETLKKILSEEGIKSNELLFIGDSDGDRMSAEEVSCKFVGVETAWNGWSTASCSFPSVSRLTEIVLE